MTKQTLMQLALTEQLRERQEMEKKLQKLSKTMDYLERAKREEAATLIEAAFQQRLLEERMIHERDQQVFLSEPLFHYIKETLTMIICIWLQFSCSFFLY